MRIVIALISSLILLAACGDVGGSGAGGGNSGGRTQKAMLEQLNILRSTSGLPPLVADAALERAAQRHAADMAAQSRPWHFGSDGSSPIDRVAQAGYGGRFVGELISETFEDELDTLAAWYSDAPSQALLLSPDAFRVGLGWYKESSGKYWYALEIGG